MAKKEKKNLFNPLAGEEYIGNIFGWKISIAGLIIILAFILLYQVAARHNKNHKDIQSNEIKKIEIEYINPPSNEDSIDIQ